MDADFDRLIQEAEDANFSGWDFAFLRGRLIEEPLPWDYLQLVRKHISFVSSMLDLCTGGGERLAGLAPLPRFTVATESHPPNVLVASGRLREAGAWVVHADGETGNSFGPTGIGNDRAFRRRLPFADSVFELIICRHGSFSAEEIARVLRHGGTFIAQLVGSDNYPHLNSTLEGAGTVWLAPDGPQPPSLEEFGFEWVEKREAKPEVIFKDIGAIVYYLKGVPWQISDFTVTRYRDRLFRLHKEIIVAGGLRTYCHRRLIVARKL